MHGPASRRRCTPTTFLIGALGASWLASGCTSAEEADGARVAGSPLSVGGLCTGSRCDQIARGAAAFSDRHLIGLAANGRACADCHTPNDAFQLSPAAAQARFERHLSTGNDDPLFRPIDADDFRTNGASASDYTNLTQHGLVRVTIDLASSVEVLDGDAPAGKADVWRIVPSVFNVRLTGNDGVAPFWPRDPNTAGGYQLDARQPTLQAQARGAFFDHAQVQSEPSVAMLDDIAAFEDALFSSARVRDFANGLTSDADGPLTDVEAKGKLVFARACGHCHGGPGQSTTQVPIVRYHDINTACPRPVDPSGLERWSFKPCSAGLARNIRTYRFTLPGGEQIIRRSSDPGRALLTGFVGGPPPLDDFNKLDVPTLHGINQTAPYFHNHSAETLDEVLDHYEEFFKFVLANRPPQLMPPVISTDFVNPNRPFSAEERPWLLAYLKTL